MTNLSVLATLRFVGIKPSYIGNSVFQNTVNNTNLKLLIYSVL